MSSRLRDLQAIYMQRLPEMEERFHTLKRRYKIHATTADALAKYWEWSALPRYELEPFYFELGDCRRGRVMRGQPEKTSGRHQYGLTLVGQLVVERQHVEFPGQFYEAFLWSTELETTRELYSYDTEKTPINASRLLHESKDFMCFQQWAQYGYAQHVYERVAGRIVTFSTTHRRFLDNAPFGGAYAVEYADDETVKIIALEPSGRRLAYEGRLAANPSIERTATGKSVSAVHVERYR